MTRYVGGYGPSDAALAIVGEAPGEQEETQGIPFVGSTGSEVRDMLSENNFKIAEAYLTNVSKWRPPNNEFKRLGETGHSLEECHKILWEEIKSVRPNAILALGNQALMALCGKSGITKYRGSVLESIMGFPKVIPTIHPSSYLRRSGQGTVDYSAKAYISLDFKKAIYQSTFKDFRTTQRSLEVCRNSLQLYQFLQDNKDKELVAVDIEVIKCMPICIGLAFSSTRALSVPLLQLDYGKNPIIVPRSELVQMWIMLAQFFDSDIKVIGQNFKFDHEKLLRPLGIRIKNFYCDTMFMAQTLHAELPKKLEFLCSIYTDEPYYKGEYREFNPKKDSLDRVYLYNAKDCAITFECYEKMLADIKELGREDFLFDYMCKLHTFYMGIERIGFKIDFDVWKRVALEYIEKDKALDKEIEDLVGHPINIRSGPQIRSLFEDAYKFPRRDSYDEDSLVQMLATKKVHDNPHIAAIIDKLLLSRRVKRFRSSVLSAYPDFDDRMRTTYNICGTETGRTSTSIMDPPVRPRKMGLSLHQLPKHGLGSEIREALIADEGYKIVNCDMSQAEARIVAILSQDEFLLDMFAQKKDIHRFTAKIALSLSDAAAESLAKDSPERFIGKTTRHGGSYDMGPRVFRDTVNSEARRAGLSILLREADATRILVNFHKYSPNIRSVFHREVKERLMHERRLTNPYGRVRDFFGRMGDELFKEGYAYIPQSTVGDHLKKAGLRIKARIPEIDIVLEQHDSFAFRIPVDKLHWCKVIKEEMEVPINFAMCSLPRGELVIPCEFEIGTNLKYMEAFSV